MDRQSAFGEFIKKARLGKGLTLREFCLKNNLDPAYVSRLERGLIPPPQSPWKLLEYASHLQIADGTEEWYEFSDLAAAETGRIPRDLLTDRELVEKLPVVFRTLRGQKVSEEKLDELAELIRRT